MESAGLCFVHGGVVVVEAERSARIFVVEERLVHLEIYGGDGV